MLRRARTSYGVLSIACLLAATTASADDKARTGTTKSAKASPGDAWITEGDDEAQPSDTAPPADADAADAETDEADAAADGPEADAAQASATSGAASASRDSSFGVGLDLYWDSGEQNIQRINSGGGNLVEGRNDIGNEGFLVGSDLALSIWWMTGIFEHAQLGANVRLLGSYNYELDGDGDVVKLGQTVEVGPRGQYLIEISEQLGVTLGLEANLVLVFPGSDLSDRIDTLDAQGFDTTSAPRLGFLLGPQVGMRYVANEWLALRADLGWLYEKIFLLDSTAESGGLTGEESWTASWTRFRLHLGTELMF